MFALTMLSWLRTGRAFAMHSLLQSETGWCFLEMRIGEFVSRGGCEHAGVIEHASHDLQAHWQSVAGETAGDARRRLLREIEREAERRPLHPGLAVIPHWRELAGIERGRGDGGRQKEIVSLHELPHRAAIGPARGIGGK